MPELFIKVSQKVFAAKAFGKTMQETAQWTELKAFLEAPCKRLSFLIANHCIGFHRNFLSEIWKVISFILNTAL